MFYAIFKSALCILILGLAIKPISADIIQPRIIGGYDCPTENLAFMVSFRKEGNIHFCCGTIIHKNWVLTAEHCLGKKFELVVGSSTIPGSKPLKIKVRDYYLPHGIFDRKPTSDIALIRLDTPLMESTCIKHVKLHEQNTSLCSNALAMGWGTVDVDKYLSPKKMKCVELPIVSNERCSHTYHPGLFNGQTMLCTLSDQGKDACGGDSGGPLLCGDVQVGITAWGAECADPTSPGVYTRVNAYMDFIHHTMKNSAIRTKRDFLLGTILPIYTLITAY